MPTTATKSALISLIALIGIGCSSEPPEQKPLVPQPILSPLLAPGSLGKDLVVSEWVTGEFDDQTHSMRVETEIGDDTLAIVGLNPIGVPLFVIQYFPEDKEVRNTTNTPLPFDPTYIVSDLQLVHWPKATLKQELEQRGMTLVTSPGTRTVVGEQGQLLVEIKYHSDGDTPTSVDVQHYELPYRLRIDQIDGPTPS